MAFRTPLYQSEGSSSGLSVVPVPNFARPNLQELYDKMPKSMAQLDTRMKDHFEELVKMKVFMLKFIQKHKMGNLKQFDENASHVLGRKFDEIDYRPDVERLRKAGRPITLRKLVERQRTSLSRVMGSPPDFTSLEKIEKYYTWEEKQAYFRKIYKPGQGQ
ncbi:MAG: hypothetical protein ABII22_04805 [Candidatus Micrarchaeota archaeon]